MVFFARVVMHQVVQRAQLCLGTERFPERFADDEEAVKRAAHETEGFTLAQLSELYVSAALQMHYENKADVERLIAEMKSDYAKGRSGQWLTDGQSRRLGFV